MLLQKLWKFFRGHRFIIFIGLIRLTLLLIPWGFQSGLEELSEFRKRSCAGFSDSKQFFFWKNQDLARFLTDLDTLNGFFTCFFSSWIHFSPLFHNHRSFEGPFHFHEFAIKESLLLCPFSLTEDVADHPSLLLGALIRFDEQVKNWLPKKRADLATSGKWRTLRGDKSFSFTQGCE